MKTKTNNQPAKEGQIREPTMNRYYYVIQVGYATYGKGTTRELALQDASEWLEDENGVQGGLTPDEVEEKLIPSTIAVDGDLVMLHPEDAEDYRD